MAHRSKKSSLSLHSEMLMHLKEAPTLFLKARLRALIKTKAPGASNKFVSAFVDHLIAGQTDSFDHQHTNNILASVEISQDELDEVLSSTWSFVKEDLPAIITRILDQSAKSLLKTLQADWPAQRTYEIDVATGFRNRLEDRWGSAFSTLRMMYTIAREIGDEARQRAQRSRAKKNLVLRSTLLHLHMRACQVFAEIICLMENGYADGAIARWRTLHEIVVVAAVLAKHGESLAQRYREHEFIEAKRAMDRYILSHAALGFAAPNTKAIDKVEREYQDALAKYGNGFGSEYGWASHHLDVKKARFIDLEAEAGKLQMRSYYVMASYNVHASAKGIAFRLGLLKGPGVPTGLAGASNAGFVEPAQNSAFDLTSITGVLLNSRIKIDEAIQLKVLTLLRNEIAGKLNAAQKSLGKAHREALNSRRKPVPAKRQL